MSVYFNSSMVRLKERMLLSGFQQTLYGSIKSYIQKRQITSFCVFQFLYGSIKSATQDEYKLFLNGISIPLWFD